MHELASEPLFQVNGCFHRLYKLNFSANEIRFCLIFVKQS